MKATKDFYVVDHKNKSNTNFELIALFEKNQEIPGSSKYERGAFQIKDYGITFELRQGTLLCLKLSDV